MRKRLSPRALFVAGLTLLAISVVGAVLFSEQGSRPVSTPTSGVSTSTVAPPAPLFVVASVAASAVGPFSTTVTWQTTAPSTGRIGWGPAGMPPQLWLGSSTMSLEHRVVLPGLASSSAYVASIEVRSATGEAASATVPFTTAPIPADVSAGVQDGTMLVGGAPFFPLITWQECPSQWSPDLTDGINLFAGNPCTGLSSLLTGVQGRALSVGTTDDTPGTTGPGLVGWFYPDEADARGLTGDSLSSPGAGLRFLTLTAHFFPQAAPLPGGRGMYPGLLDRADVVGFDLYPLQELCRPELIPWIFDAQQHLTQLAGPRPTFQWIEVREMKCPDPANAVTPRTIRVESWLAIAGGARGLGFFPSDWGTEVGAAVRDVSDRIRQLEPALLQAPVPVGVDPYDSGVRASAREFGGVLYVIAVNAAQHVASVRLDVPGLDGRALQPIGNGSSLDSRGTTVDAVLPPMSVRIYTTGPGSLP